MATSVRIEDDGYLGEMRHPSGKAEQLRTAQIGISSKHERSRVNRYSIPESYIRAVIHYGEMSTTPCQHLRSTKNGRLTPHGARGTQEHIIFYLVLVR